MYKKGRYADLIGRYTTTTLLHLLRELDGWASLPKCEKFGRHLQTAYNRPKEQIMNTKRLPIILFAGGTVFLAVLIALAYRDFSL